MLCKQLQSSSLDTHRSTVPSTASPSLPEGLYTELWISDSLQPAHEMLRLSDVLHGCSGRPHQRAVQLRHHPSEAVWRSLDLARPRTQPPELRDCPPPTPPFPLA